MSRSGGSARRLQPPVVTGSRVITNHNCCHFVVVLLQNAVFLALVPCVRSQSHSQSPPPVSSLSLALISCSLTLSLVSCLSSLVSLPSCFSRVLLTDCLVALLLHTSPVADCVRVASFVTYVSTNIPSTLLSPRVGPWRNTQGRDGKGLYVSIMCERRTLLVHGSHTAPHP